MKSPAQARPLHNDDSTSFILQKSNSAQSAGHLALTRVTPQTTSTKTDLVFMFAGDDLQRLGGKKCIKVF